MTDTHVFRPDPARSVLIVVDAQERVAASMPEDVRQEVIKNIGILIQGAKALNIPIIYTEQYPKGLGPTMPELREMLGDQKAIEKITFSCYDVPEFRKVLEDLKVEDVFLCGMETHVCLYQTALDLIEDDYHVFAVADAMSSRKKMSWKLGINSMREAGALIGSTEMFLFQFLEEAGTDQFKIISRLVR